MHNDVIVAITNAMYIHAFALHLVIIIIIILLVTVQNHLYYTNNYIHTVIYQFHIYCKWDYT